MSDPLGSNEALLFHYWWDGSHESCLVFALNDYMKMMFRDNDHGAFMNTACHLSDAENASNYFIGSYEIAANMFANIQIGNITE